MHNPPSVAGTLARTRNCLLVDLENVRPDHLELLYGREFRVLVFAGAAQHSIPLPVTRGLQPLGRYVEYVQISGNGRNALDFHIACYIGELAARGAADCFHILSKDTGFDPLVDHLRRRHIIVHRWPSIDAMTFLRRPVAPPPDDELQSLAGKLKAAGKCRPAKVDTLCNWIRHVSSDRPSTEAAMAIAEKLASRGVLAIEGSKVRYIVAA